MGHANADYDCFGAALGLQRAARNLAKKPYIIYDNSYGVKNIVNEINKNQEYDGMLISAEEALSIATEETLVVILDTHRANMLPAPELLKKVNKVIILFLFFAFAVEASSASRLSLSFLSCSRSILCNAESVL